MLHAMSSPQIPYPVRMPHELRERLSEQAKLNNRSLHAEIVGILQRAIDLPPADAAPATAGDLADAIVTRIVQAQAINEDRLAESIASKVGERLRPGTA